MKPWAATPLRIPRLADRLNNLAVELVEPILRDLPLDVVLQLACTPAAKPTTSRLRWAIENSPSWKPIFMGKLERFRTLWESLVHFAWFWNLSSIHSLPSLKTWIWSTAGELVRAGDVLPKLEETFRSGFQTIMGITPVSSWNNRRDLYDESGYNPVRSPALLDAVCAFIPSHVVSLIDNRDYETLTQILPGEHDGTSTQREQWAEQMAEASKVTPTSADASPLLSHHGRVNHAGKWDAGQFQAFLPYFIHAHDHLNIVKSDELVRIAALYETYPAWLKTPYAPQSPAPRPNTQHISAALRVDAETIRNQLIGRQIYRWRRFWHRFRNPHPALVPTDEALQIFEAHGDVASSYPKDLQPDARRVRDGFSRIYKHDGTLGQDVRCVSEGSPSLVRHVVHRDARYRAHPSPQAELQWLESLMHCVQWISEHAPRPASQSLPRPLLEPRDYHRYVASEPAQVIAEQLLVDRQISEATTTSGSRLPSLTALYMPPYSSQRTRDVAKCVWPDMDAIARQLLWDEMIKKIRRGLAKPPPLPSHEDQQILAYDASAQPADDITARRDAWENSYRYRTSQKATASGTYPTCYICRMHITEPHKTLSAMCHPCGEFNLAGSSLSLPQNLDLQGQTALVTGGRINLGFHVALRLLRCGARVIVSTRYPRDAIARYRSQPDAGGWADRLRVVGADFRSARDAFELVAQVKTVVEEWGGTLDILINNAAQTLTDSLETEKMAIRRETFLGRGKDLMLVEGPSVYQPRIRGGMTANMALQGLGPRQASAQEIPSSIAGPEGGKELGSLTSQMSKTEISRTSQPSSWIQSMSDIPYEDIISAHSVNTFVPLILIRELLPIMQHKGRSKAANAMLPSSPQHTSAGVGYVVNVSSREGIFEARASHQSKAGKHVHTNMSKAGLNMITETEASSAWKSYHVAINTVDPGYMSAAPELEDAHGGERPLGWEDGAGRVLWPVAVGEGKRGGVLRGRFLKHYGAVGWIRD